MRLIDSRPSHCEKRLNDPHPKMKRHWNYLKYLLRHKYYVWVAGHALGLGWWRLLIHDWHKFLPSEWCPYAKTFYEPDGTKRYLESDEFSYAWNLHQKRAAHHWQHWLITWDRGETKPLMMDAESAVEMVADWMGAGKAITGKWGAWSWYIKNKEKIQLHPITRGYVESLLVGSTVSIMETTNKP